MEKKKLGFGFFLMCAALIVAIVSVVLYGNSYVTTPEAYKFMIAAIVAGAVALIGSFFLPKVFNWCTIVAALLMAAGIAYSITVMADPIGYVISGLYEASTLTGWITYIIVAAVSWLLLLVTGFAGVAKEK